jgi:hypothetical protein
LNAFLASFSEVVEKANDGEMDLFASLTNSNLKFMGNLKDFVDSISKTTGVSTKQIEGVATL